MVVFRGMSGDIIRVIKEFKEIVKVSDDAYRVVLDNNMVFRDSCDDEDTTTRKGVVDTAYYTVDGVKTISIVGM